MALGTEHLAQSRSAEVGSLGLTTEVSGGQTRAAAGGSL